MARAAVPNYLKTESFPEATPGLRFGMFLKLWGEDIEEGTMVWGVNDMVTNNDKGTGKSKAANNKGEAMHLAAALNESDRERMLEWGKRQSEIARNISASAAVLALKITSVSPLATGLGQAHPLENGCAFLEPYGLPYLPGSSIKGVFRQAARDLASGTWGSEHGWNDEAIHVLFGPAPVELNESDGQDSVDPADQSFDITGTETRGALLFWDVMPQLPERGKNLRVEVMTPHLADYLHNGDEGPNETRAPNPILFLSIPPESEFIFHVQCETSRLVDHAELLQNWQGLVQEAFKHACRWLGFGAKTAVGYGQFVMLNEDRLVWRDAILEWDPGRGTIVAVKQDSPSGSGAGPRVEKTAPLSQQKSKELIDALGEREQQQLKKKKNPLKVNIKIIKSGNKFEIDGLA